MIRPLADHNRTLPFRVEGFRTLIEGLDYAARGETGFGFHDGRGRLVAVLTYGELAERARDLAPRLLGLGLARGDRVALVATTDPDFITLFFACQHAGLVPVPLPLPVNLGGREAYVARLAAMMRAAGARLAVAGTDFQPMLAEAAVQAGVPAALVPAEVAACPPRGRPVPFGEDDPCYIQYSSGSTSMPRGVLVTQRALVANARAIARDGLGLRPGDRCVSWLPLYHDMGLVGCCLTPTLAQIPVDYLAPTAFARRPLLWIELISRYRATISYAPTFGYELAARRAERGGDLARFDLTSWRVAGLGGEMIRPAVLDRFARIFRPAGFDPRAFVASYGLAEATLAVTFAPVGQGLRCDLVRRDDTLERARLAIPARPGEGVPVRDFVRCGRPLPGYRVEIRDEAGRALPERHVGRICIAGPSLMREYFRDPAASARVFEPDGMLDTGDLGYLVDGELVVTGRSKDLIIVGGRNIWPQDLEWAVERLSGVRAGDVAAFAAPDEEGREEVVVVVECRLADPAARARLRREVRGVVARTAGIDCRVLLVPPRSLAYTTSGKLSRATVRARWLRGELMDLDAAPPLPTVLAAPESAVEPV